MSARTVVKQPVDMTVRAPFCRRFAASHSDSAKASCLAFLHLQFAAIRVNFLGVLPVKTWARMVFVLMLALVFVGCSSPSRQAKDREAFLAGQEQAFQMLQRNGILVVRLIGPFKRQVLSWRNGMTVAQAIVEGGYTEAKAPTHIVVHNGFKSRSVDPQSLLKGEDIPVKPGDVLEVLP